MELNKNYSKVSKSGLLIALGIIYGDIGTSPLYTMSSIIGKSPINELLVYGGVSCIFWTLTLQTTLKYVVITLRADNNGEGGIFSLFALLKKNYRWLTIAAILGGSALLADGIITPPISISSAIEGLQIIYPHLYTVPIVIVILSLLFIFQVLGAEKVGKSFGPVMLIWFLMLGILGVVAIANNPKVLTSINPYYAYNLLTKYPNGFWLLGSVFLCTTGAEALYSDMGHCGRPNVRVSWGFVKTSLLLNYFGQAAWLISQQGKHLTVNPFYAIMPSWFLITGIIISTFAVIIASQALITGSYTLINEAIKLNFWPKVKIVYPSILKGQLYVPSVNILLWMGCLGVVLYFEKSSRMEAAYGLAITVTMLMTTILLMFYLHMRKVPMLFIIAFSLLYLTIEISFLTANLLKFMHGGYVSVIITCILLFIMLVWNEAIKIQNKLTDFVDIRPFIPKLKELSEDKSIPKFGTHLIYLTSSGETNLVESRIIYSILEQKPKRADIYWLINIEVSNEPYTSRYKVEFIANEDVIKINLILGFRMGQMISMYFKKIISVLEKNKEVDITSRYQSLNKDNIIGDFTFVIMKKFISYENKLPLYEKIILGTYFFIKYFTKSQESWFGLDANNVVIEKVPLVIKPLNEIRLERII